MKVGDKVKANQDFGGITKGVIYTVRYIAPPDPTGTYVCLKEVSGIYNNNRFIPSTNNVDTLPSMKAAVPVAVKEAPCSTCKRMNDIGVKTCWCCGGKP